MTDTVTHLKLAWLDLISDWHHKTMPDGEYATSVEQLTNAYPTLTERYDVEERVSQYTKKLSIMIKLKVK